MGGILKNAMKSVHDDFKSHAKWPHQLSQEEQIAFVAVPLGLFFLILCWRNFCGFWPLPKLGEMDDRRKASTTVPTDDHGDIPEHATRIIEVSSGPRIIESGEMAQEGRQYSEDWKTTFDLTFLVFMIVFFLVLLGVTTIYEPHLLHNIQFWKTNGIKLFIICFVSLCGGALCRCYCDVDEHGYILTSKASWFKVNYTRKFQHFAAYAVPLLVKTNIATGYPQLHLVWGDFFTLLGFLVLIKPLRENFSPFMYIFILQFKYIVQC